MGMLICFYCQRPIVDDFILGRQCGCPEEQRAELEVLARDSASSAPACRMPECLVAADPGGWCDAHRPIGFLDGDGYSWTGIKWDPLRLDPTHDPNTDPKAQV